MEYFILRSFNDIQKYLPQVQHLSDQQKKALGFLPPIVYEQAAVQERLWVVIDQMNKYIGHLLFGGVRPSLKIFQIAVEKKSCGKGIAKRLLNELEAYGNCNDYMSIVARVAADLNSNSFWEHCGYPILRQEYSNENRKRTINIRGKQLKVGTLFDNEEISNELSVSEIKFIEHPLLSNLNYVLDLNFIYDIHKHRLGEITARQVMKLALSGPYQFYIAREVFVELGRTCHDKNNDNVLTFVSDFSQLPEVPHEKLSGILNELNNILHPGVDLLLLSPNDKSDLLHLAEAIHHRTRGFVTSDKIILRNAKAISGKFGIEVISPYNLVSITETSTVKNVSLSAGDIVVLIPDKQ